MIRSFDFQRLFYELPAPFMILDLQLRFVDMNRRYLEVTERARDELVGRYVFEAFPESGERLAMFKDAFERAVAGEANRLVKQPFSIARPADQGGGMRDVWWTCHHIPIHDYNGALCGMLQKAEDVTTEVEIEHMREVISLEFDHRIKNTLTTVMALARRTANSSASPETFVAEFETRIAAMAHTHQILVDSGWTSACLKTLIESQLSAYSGGDSAVSLSGPELTLSSKQTQALGMALHELATNAAKHGALSRPDGKLEIQWRLEPDGLCALDWSESGLVDLAEPQSAGFGSTIVDSVLPKQLAGRVERQFAPTGMRCSIVFPLETP